MADPISKIPIVLFPLKIETRFIKEQIWIRVLPDKAFLHSHDPLLTKEERADAFALRKLPTQEKKDQWEVMVSRYGVYRSSWLVNIDQTELEKQEEDARLNGDKTDDQEPTFYFQWLPEKFLFSLYYKDKDGKAKLKKHFGSQVFIKKLIVLGEGDKWVQDFDEALKVGMATRIDLPNDWNNSFEKVIVSGYRDADDPLEPAQGLTQLFMSHQYTEGFSFVEYGTPTNNSDTAQSGYSSKDEYDAVNSYASIIDGLDLGSSKHTEVHSLSAGNFLSYSLGLDNAPFKNIKNANLTPIKLHELFQRASWFGLGAQTLFMLLGDQIGSNSHEALWKHFSKYVKPRGLFSTLKIGDQPYGVLPVMNISNALTDEGRSIRESTNLLDKLQVIMALLFRRWLPMADGADSRVPKLDQEGDAYHEMIELFSMQEGSSNFRIRSMEYQYFQKRLSNWLRFVASDTKPIPTDTDFQKDFELAQAHCDLILSLFPTSVKEEGLPLQTHINLDRDKLMRSPLLAFNHNTSSLLGFDHGNSVLTYPNGAVKEAESSSEEFSFPMTQANLSSLQKLIDDIQQGPENTLPQYEGELSLFTDLFLRSYTNACQLYYREIVFDPRIEALRGYPYFSVKKIFKGEGKNEGKVKKGDTVIELVGYKNGEGVPSKVIKVTAPFTGYVQKIKVTEIASEQLDIEKNIRPGTALFVLIDEGKYQQIKNSFLQLGQQIIDANNAIVEKDRAAVQTNAMTEAFDLSTYRLDAWATSLAANKIDQMRQTKGYEKGIYFGAYGWVENLERDLEQPVQEKTLANGSTVLLDENRNTDGGIIHTPNAAQAVASAVFKNAFLSYEQDEENNTEQRSNPFTLNLTSDRLQKGQFLLEGIRQGQQLEALLGYQLERYLHDAGLDTEIYTLREAFPLYENSTTTNGQTTGFVNLSVINGMKVLENKDNLQSYISDQEVKLINAKKIKEVSKCIAKLADILDGSLDTLFYEAGYQITQGNLSQAAAALDATKGAIEPPKIESLKTKVKGTGIHHKLVMLFSNELKTYPIENTRAFANPVLENWLEENIGPLNQIGCTVDLIHSETEELIDSIEVTMDQLNIGHAHLLYLSDMPTDEGASELEMRIWHIVFLEKGEQAEEVTYSITDIAPDGCQSLPKALEVLRFAKTLLDKCRSLKSEDLSMEGEAIEEDRMALDQIKKERLQPIVDFLRGIKESELSQIDVLTFLSEFDLDDAKFAWLGGVPLKAKLFMSDLEQKIQTMDELLAKYGEEKDFHTAFEYLSKVAKLLFGKTFLLFPPAVSSDNFSKVVTSTQQALLVGDRANNTAEQVWGEERLTNWVQSIAQVHENSEAFEDWLMVRKIWEGAMGLSNELQFKVVQGPTMMEYPWVGLSKIEIDSVLSNHYASKPIYKDPSTGKSYPFDNGDYYPDGCDSVVLYTPQKFTPKKGGKKIPVFGLVIEEFTEHVPDKKLETGVSFHYNAPNNEPPQAILVAVHPKATEEEVYDWNEEMLRDIISDTIDLYKIRMVDLDAIQDFGDLIPMPHWFNIPRIK